MMRDEPQLPHVASARQLLRATVVALGAALVLLFGAVLPAEFGVDPLRIGAVLGLTALGQSTRASPPIPLLADGRLVPAPMGPLGYYPLEYKTDSVELTIDPYQFVEYKYRLEKGATMLFAWEAGRPVRVDFHGVPDDAPRGTEESYDTRDAQTAAATFTAPFSGIHGWFWDNRSEVPVVITLSSAGFYSAAVEILSNRTQRVHELTPVRPR